MAQREALSLGLGEALCVLGQANTLDCQSCAHPQHPDSPAQTLYLPLKSHHPLSTASPHMGGMGHGEDGGEDCPPDVVGNPTRPLHPPSPTSRSISPKYLLIFIYILCPRCPAPVRSHLHALVLSCQLHSSSLKSRARSCVWLGVGGGET